MEKLYTSKTFLKMDGGKMHTPHSNPLDLPQAIRYRNHQKSLAYFSHLAPLILFFFTKRQRQKGVGNSKMPSPKYAPGNQHQPLSREFSIQMLSPHQPEKCSRSKLWHTARRTTQQSIPSNMLLLYWRIFAQR